MLKLAGELLEGQLAEHIAHLDAHTKAPFEILRTGAYYGSLYRADFAGANTAITANRLYAVPFLVPRAMTFDRIGIYVFTAGAGGTKARLGIYNNGTNLYPGTLVEDCGEVAVDSTGLKEITISQSLTKGLYWLVFVSDGTPSFRYTSNVLNILGETNPQNSRATWEVSFTYSALADPFPASAGIYYNLWGIGLRIASLD